MAYGKDREGVFTRRHIEYRLLANLIGYLVGHDTDTIPKADLLNGLETVRPSQIENTLKPLLDTVFHRARKKKIGGEFVVSYRILPEWTIELLTELRDFPPWTKEQAFRPTGTLAPKRWDVLGAIQARKRRTINPDRYRW